MEFGLPDEACRAEIIKIYAKHLSQEDMAAIAAATPGLAGRDLKDLSEQAERRWASKVLLAACLSLSASLGCPCEHLLDERPVPSACICHFAVSQNLSILNRAVSCATECSTIPVASACDAA